MNQRKDKKILLIILLTGLVVRLFLFFYFLDQPKFFQDDDSSDYLGLAENLRLGYGFSWDQSPAHQINGHRTPAYPLFLLFHRWVFGGYGAALIGQSILVTLVGWLIFLIAKKYLRQPTLGLAAAAIFLFTPFSLNVSLKFLTQPFFTFVLVLGVWYWLQFLTQKNSRHLIIGTALFSLAALIRPIAQYLWLPLVFSLFYFSWLSRPRWPLKKILTASLVVILIFWGLLTPWLFRNYLEFEHFALSSITWSQLYFYDAPAIWAKTRHLSYVEAAGILSRQAEQNFAGASREQIFVRFSSTPWLKERTLAIFFESPLSLAAVRTELFFKFFIRDGLRSWYDDLNPAAKTKIGWAEIFTFPPHSVFVYGVLLERAAFLGLLAGWLAASVFAFRRGGQEQFLIHFFVLLVFYFAVLTGIMASAGFRFPAEPFLILAGLWGWQEAGRKIFKKFY